MSRYSTENLYPEGLPLDEERQAKREERAKLLKANPDLMRQAKQFINTVARSEGGKVGLAPREDSTYNKLQGKVPAEVEALVADLPPVVKRSRQARLDSMIARLVDLPRPLLEAKLHEVHGEFWKQGMPVAYEDLKRVAAQYMNSRQVNRNAQVPTIRGTRT